MTDRPILLVDLDGTITDSLDGIAKSLHHALGVVGARWDDSRDIRSIAGPPMVDTLTSLGLAGAAFALRSVTSADPLTALGSNR